METLKEVVGERRSRGKGKEYCVEVVLEGKKRAKRWMGEEEVPASLIAQFEASKIAAGAGAELAQASYAARPASLNPLPAGKLRQPKELQSPSQSSRGFGARLQRLARELQEAVEKESAEEERNAGKGISAVCLGVRPSDREDGSTMLMRIRESLSAPKGGQVVLSRQDLRQEAPLLGIIVDTVTASQGKGKHVDVTVQIYGPLPETPKACSWNIAVNDKWPTYIVQQTAIRELVEKPSCMSMAIREVLVSEHKSLAVEEFASRSPVVGGFLLPKSHEMRQLLTQLNVQCNPSQLQAAESIVKRSITLIQGPPGTGKSYFGSAMVAALVNYNRAKGGARQPLLVTSDTNCAVDHFLELLEKRGVKRMVRLCRRDSTSLSATARKYLLREDDDPDVSFDQRLANRHSQIGNADVVLCTNTSSARLHGFSFPIHFIDEAAVSSLPSALVGLVSGCTLLVLLGDHRQLAPFSNLPPEILKLQHGGGVSIFERLLDLGVESTVLRRQWRMHADIVAFPSAMFYAGQLEQAMDVSDFPDVKGIPSSPFRVACVHVEGVEEWGGSKSCRNLQEVEKCRQLLQSIQLPPGRSSIAIITFYRDQVQLLRSMIPASPHLRIDTVDAFQGKEADLVILSMVRSGKRGKLGFLKDSRRINVALTRAKLALIVVCNRNTLADDPLLKSWLDFNTELSDRFLC